MRQFMTFLGAFLADDSGQDLTEYGLLACLIAVVAVVAVRDVGIEFTDWWGYIVEQFVAAL